MQIALCADIHFGMHSGNEAYALSIDNALTAMFEDILNKNIQCLIILGDLFDTRFSINQLAEDNARKHLERIEREFVQINVLPGNHDCYYANTARINSLNKYGRICRIFSKPEVILDKILILPWICEENEKECLEAIKKTTSPYCFGHFDIKGAKMNGGHLSEEGLDQKLFKKFKKVFSGHFHSRQIVGNIEYIGSLIQTNFGDTGEQRGYTILDTDTGETGFVELPGMKHLRIKLTENFKPEDYDLQSNAVELLVPDNLWNDRFSAKAERIIMEAGVTYFAGAKKDMDAVKEIESNLPSMERDESILDYMTKYVNDADLKHKSEILTELKRLHSICAV